MNIKFILSLLLFFCTFSATAQLSLRVQVTDHEGAPLPGVNVTVKETGSTFTTDSAGYCNITDLKQGAYTLEFSHAGFESVTRTFAVPVAPGNPIAVIEMEEGGHHDEEEVIVQATRTSRTIANSPTRVEVISGEELEEKGNMKPGDIRMLLNESTGIQVQQTSATSYNSSIRIQGLDGRYTQILKDGFPLYGGFSGGLSLLQVVPLDLRQVEVIKGSASTLYGGGAIAGLVNLVTRTPGEERQVNFMANGTSGGGLDLSGFYSENFGKLGTTVFASRNSNKEFDPGNTGFTAIPKFERYTFNPRILYSSGSLSMDAGFNYTTEERLGGAMEYVKNESGTGYFEENLTDRMGIQTRITNQLNDHSSLQLKASYNKFDRTLWSNAYGFSGIQNSVFSELTWHSRLSKAEWVAGLNYLSDNFEEKELTFPVLRDYEHITWGAFVQNTLNAGEKVTVESGLRADHVNEFGFEILPRISLMYRVTPRFTTRIGGGLGYKPPTIFNEESERIQFRNLFPIDENRTKNERSAGFNADFNLTANTGPVQWSFNQLFFYTRITDPLQLMGAPGGKVEFLNADGSIETQGMETNVKGVLGDFKLFVGYTYANVKSYINGFKSRYPLTPKHRLNNVLMYEVEEKLKLGLEAYYIGEQKVTAGANGRSYWITGFMAEKIWEKFSVFINFENFTNTRQSRWEPIYTGTLQNPVFKDIYAPVEGFVFNGGFKLRL